MHPDQWLPLFSQRLSSEAINDEILITLFLARHAEVVDTLMAEGDRYALTLPIRQIMKQAREVDAYQILLIHSHPSGDPSPSPEDILVTRRLCLCLRREGLRMMDHIILTKSRYFSFRAHRML